MRCLIPPCRPDPLLCSSAAVPYPLFRWGGNAATRYNYVYDVTNHASDWYFLNEAQGEINGQNTAAAFVESCAAANASALLTVPTIGYVACSGGTWGANCPAKAPGFSVKKYGAQKATECTQGQPSWCDADAGDGVWLNGSNVVGNDPADTSVVVNASFVVDWIASLRSGPGGAALRGIALDNGTDEIVLGQRGSKWYPPTLCASFRDDAVGLYAPRRAPRADVVRRGMEHDGGVRICDPRRLPRPRSARARLGA